MIFVPNEATSAEDHAIKVIIQRAIRAWLPKSQLHDVSRPAPIECNDPRGRDGGGGRQPDFVRGSGVLTELFESREC